MKKILHITESLGGGVATAMQGYLQSTPQHWHFLLAAAREGTHDKMGWLQGFAGHYELPRSLSPAVKTIRKVYDDIKPDWVHLHSSYAGAYGRMAMLPRNRVVYTPHCYAFERRDVSKLKRWYYMLAEQLLCIGGGATAAVSPRELELAQKMLIAQHTILLPNSPVIPENIRELRRGHKRGEKLRIAMVGRLSPQKDPTFFLETVNLAKERDVPAEFVWLGGGDAAWEKKMRAAGVEVSGWMPHEQLLAKLAGCDIYYHTAAWESCPMSILEASHLGLLLVCRDTPAIASLPVQPIVPSVKAAVDSFTQMAWGESLDTSPFAAINDVLNKNYNETTQRDALLDLYGD
ncbi:MAG: glycosyltransferase [Alphaproteobacteria bacterium]